MSVAYGVRRVCLCRGGERERDRITDREGASMAKDDDWGVSLLTPKFGARIQIAIRSISSSVIVS